LNPLRSRLALRARGSRGSGRSDRALRSGRALGSRRAGVAKKRKADDVVSLTHEDFAVPYVVHEVEWVERSAAGGFVVAHGCVLRKSHQKSRARPKVAAYFIPSAPRRP
jgi:hypothetical protein